MVVQVDDGRFLRRVTRKQNHELLSEFGVEPSLGQILSDEHDFMVVVLKDDVLCAPSGLGSCFLNEGFVGSTEPIVIKISPAVASRSILKQWRCFYALIPRQSCARRPCTRTTMFGTARQ